MDCTLRHTDSGAFWLTGRQRDRVFVYDQFLSILNEGTEANNP
jgi:hypothetical protein